MEPFCIRLLNFVEIGQTVAEMPRFLKTKSAGRNGSSGVLIMSLSVIVPEKSCGNKVWQRRRTNFWPFGIAVEWP